MFLNREEGMSYFQDVLRTAVNRWRSAFARSLLQEMHTFADELTPEQSYELIFANARLLRAEENPHAALREHERLKREASAAWFAEQEVEILIEKGRCYLTLSQLREAAECFTQALTLVRTRGDQTKEVFLLNLLGFIHRRRGEFDTAKEFYDACRAIQKATGQEVSYADTLNNLSNVLRLKGRIEEALRFCKMGLLLRRRLAEQRKISERSVALSLSTLGLIYISAENFDLAEQTLHEAFELYSRLGDKQSMAMGYNRLGRVLLAKGDLEEAKAFFKQAQEASEDVNMEALIASLNRQGRIYLIQGQWTEAVPLFQRALEVADQIHDFYQRVECLIDFATVRERLGQREEALRLWKEAQEISDQENYRFLQARAEWARGEVSYDAGDYMTAFAHYGQSCWYAVQHNMPEYQKSLRKLSDKLLAVPAQYVSDILASLTAFWNSLDLAEKYPEFLDVCTQTQEFINL
jgi:tetratricopeptide (TPR) repeat protein